MKTDNLNTDISAATLDTINTAMNCNLSGMIADEPSDTLWNIYNVMATMLKANCDDATSCEDWGTDIIHRECMRAIAFEATRLSPQTRSA